MPQVLLVIPQPKCCDEDTNKTFLVKKLIIIAFLGFTLSGCGGGGSGGGSSAQAVEISTQSTPVMTGIVFENFTSSDTDGVLGVSCPSDQTVINTSCKCKIPESGDIFSLSVVGNSAFCACSVVSGGLANSPIEVTARCSKAVMTDALTGATIQKPTIGSLPSEDMIQKWEEEMAAEEARLHEMRAMRQRVGTGRTVSSLSRK